MSTPGLVDLVVRDALQIDTKMAHEDLNRSPRHNWVENSGQLPAYVQHIAKDLSEERGMPLDRAIPMAIGVCKRWCRGGGKVTAETRAKACTAVAEWEALKGKNAARMAGKHDDADLESKTAGAMPDGSFPIPDREHVRKAVMAHGRAKDPAAAKRHIVARARALGATDLLPDDWKSDLPLDEKTLPKQQKCSYCKEQATKRILHSEGMAYIPTCDEHLGKGKTDAAASVPSGPPDPSNIVGVQDIKTDEELEGKAFVRTAAGVARFHAPIGSEIHPDGSITHPDGSVHKGTATASPVDGKTQAEALSGGKTAAEKAAIMDARLRAHGGTPPAGSVASAVNAQATADAHQQQTAAAAAAAVRAASNRIGSSGGAPPAGVPKPPTPAPVPPHNPANGPHPVQLRNLAAASEHVSQADANLPPSARMRLRSIASTLRTAAGADTPEGKEKLLAEVGTGLRGLIGVLSRNSWSLLAPLLGIKGLSGLQPLINAHHAAAGGGKKEDTSVLDELEWKDETAGEGIEHKALPAAAGTAVLSTDDRTGVVEALVSVTGIEDRVKDVIHAGAYKETLLAREPIGVWSHDDKTWVARAEQTEEWSPGDSRLPKKMDNGQPWPRDAGALYVKSRFNLETPHGAAAYSDVKFFQGKTGWSIGYRVKDAKRDPRTGVRHIKSLDLYEFSPVMVGAAPQATTLSVKSWGHTVDPDEAPEVPAALAERERLVAARRALGLDGKADNGDLETKGSTMRSCLVCSTTAADEDRHCSRCGTPLPEAKAAEVLDATPMEVKAGRVLSKATADSIGSAVQSLTQGLQSLTQVLQRAGIDLDGDDDAEQDATEPAGADDDSATKAAPDMVMIGGKAFVPFKKGQKPGAAPGVQKGGDTAGGADEGDLSDDNLDQLAEDNPDEKALIEKVRKLPPPLRRRALTKLRAAADDGKKAEDLRLKVKADPATATFDVELVDAEPAALAELRARRARLVV